MSYNDKLSGFSVLSTTSVLQETDVITLESGGDDKVEVSTAA